MKKRTRMYVMSLVFGMALGALVGCSSKQDSNNESSSKVSEKAQENSDKNTAKKSFVFCTQWTQNSRNYVIKMVSLILVWILIMT